MTLDESLGVLEKRLKHPRVQQMTSSLHRALVDGRSFSQALRDFPRIFPPLYVNMVGAGEASGALPDILSRVVQHLMQEKSLRDRVQQALIYPAFLVLADAGAYGFVMASNYNSKFRPAEVLIELCKLLSEPQQTVLSIEIGIVERLA